MYIYICVKHFGMANTKEEIVLNYRNFADRSGRAILRRGSTVWSLLRADHSSRGVLPNNNVYECESGMS